MNRKNKQSDREILEEILMILKNMKASPVVVQPSMKVYNNKEVMELLGVKDSNLRSLTARHVSNVLVSNAHPYFHCISSAKVQCHSAAFLRNKKKVTKKDYYSLMIIDKLAFPISTKHKCPNVLLITSNHSGILM